MPTPTPTSCDCDWTPSPPPVVIPTPTPTPAPTGFITLSKKVTVTTDDKFRLQIWTSEATASIDPAVFLYRQTPPMPEATEPNMSYQGVCSFSDWKNYRADSPQYSTGYFRTRYVDVTFTSLTDLENLWDTITVSLTALCTESDSLAFVTPVTSVYQLEVLS